MGCCMCKENKYNEAVNERSSLVRNEVGGVSSSRPIHEDGTVSVSSISRTDEESLLSRIVHKTADEIIDVSAIEPHSMERAEYMEKMRQYQERAGSGNVKVPKHKSNLPNTNAPVNILIGEPINASDIKLITNSTSMAADAVSKMEVKFKEPLVVPFGIDNSIPSA
ncbi:ragulator complex protein LAMTOR1-like [Rhopilema esculentum]|uniref:ragulator complex protein LAMTOR1-like n=1 Tax=Rhopilema esculentum TaxID=499914 RepID=UPI0031DF6217